MPPPPRRTLRRLLLLVAALAAVVVAVPAAGASDGEQLAQEAGPSVDVEILQVEGAVDPPVVSAIRDLVREAADRGSALVLIQLDSPGGLAVDREDVVAAVRDGEAPVVVWVGPGPADAAGVATFLATAADLTAAARGATLGPACPLVAGAAGCTDDDVARLADLVAEAATGAGQGEVRPEELPLEGSWSADQALDAGLVALTVDDYASLLQDLNGRELTTAAGAVTLDLPEEDLTVRLHTLGLLRRVLHASLNPLLVTFLLLGLLLLIAFEVFQPGFGVAGVAALLVAPLLVYGLIVMPVTWWAVALLIVGVTLLGIDLAIAGLGPPTFLGAAATTGGLFWLFPDGSPILHVPTWVNVLLAAFTVLYFVVIMTIVLRAQAGPEIGAAAEDLVGEVGVVRSTMNPEGHVFVAGALWRARCSGPDVGRVRTGTTVRVSGVDGAVLLVEPTDREPARP